MEDDNEKVKGSSKKRLRKPKSLEFVGWGSRNLIEFLESLGRDTTNKISENDVTAIIMNYIREKSRETPLKSKKRRKTVACDEKLRLLFALCRNQEEDLFYDDLYASEDDKQQRLSLSDKVAKQTKQVVSKPRGTFAAIVRDNVKLLYLRKSLVQELAKTPETFESKVVGTFVRIKNPCQLVHVTGVKEGDPIDGNLFQVTNYSYYLKDVTTSSLSDDDFSQEECEELHQRINNGFAKRLTVVSCLEYLVVDMEEKARSLHEDVTKHWIARELVVLQRLINQANEKGWRREYPLIKHYQY
ncbi:putative chromatin remodeling SWIB-Plus-3 family [Arabidopsis thaliana]